MKSMINDEQNDEHEHEQEQVPVPDDQVNTDEYDDAHDDKSPSPVIEEIQPSETT